MKAACLVLPPSEGKEPGGRGAWAPDSGRFGPHLADARVEIAERLQKFVRNANSQELGKFFGVSGAHLERAVASAEDGFVGTPQFPARDRYSGVVFGHLDLASLEAGDRRWCANRVVVVSGLLGLVAAGDPTPDYRLKMGARLPEIGSLAQWWKPRLLEAAAAVLPKSGVIDLLPNEHAAAFDPTQLGRRTAVVRFVAANGANAAGHAAKAAKGLVARSIVTGRDGDVVQVCEQFAAGGFAFRSATVNGRRTDIVIAAD